jgi:hypothetical protein
MWMSRGSDAWRGARAWGNLWRWGGKAVGKWGGEADVWGEGTPRVEEQAAGKGVGDDVSRWRGWLWVERIGQWGALIKFCMIAATKSSLSAWHCLKIVVIYSPSFS